VPVVSVSNLHYSYPPLVDGQPPASVLRGVDLEIARGEFVSIMGPTGVGKTTLCLALNGIVPQSTGGIFRGDVEVCGMNTKHTPVATLAATVGIVFQDPESQFFNMTVEDEVAFGAESLGVPPAEIVERVDWALETVGMAEYCRRSPLQLSGGQKQRVAIASILAMYPRVLVLDEPTSGLDPVGKADVFRVVRGLKQRHDVTIVMVEQDAEQIAEFSDRVIVLNEGVVALDGVPRDVFARAELMAEIGLAIPQVSELAMLHNRAFGTEFSFLDVDEAAAGLLGELERSL